MDIYLACDSVSAMWAVFSWEVLLVSDGLHVSVISWTAGLAVGQDRGAAGALCLMSSSWLAQAVYMAMAAFPRQ